MRSTDPCPPRVAAHPLSLSARLVRLEADAAELRRLRAQRRPDEALRALAELLGLPYEDMIDMTVREVACLWHARQQAQEDDP